MKENKATWERSFANELGRLAGGVGDQVPTGTKTIFFIPHSKMPSKQKATYDKIVCEYKPHKYKKHRSRLTVGGNRVDYPFPVATPTVDITAFKCLVNSVLSIKNAFFFTTDIRDFNTPMTRYEYMKLPFDIIPNKITQQ